MNKTNYFTSVTIAILSVCAAGAPAAAQGQGADKPANEGKGAGHAPVPIHFEGFLPGTTDTTLEGKFDVEFRLYRTPQGGEPVWRERHQLEVVDGRINVHLGLEHPIPMEIHEATFKWLGASVGGQREIYPRYHVVNVVFASHKEALLAIERTAEQPKGPRATRDAARTIVSATTEPVRTWREALDEARGRGVDLLDFKAWYEALSTSSVADVGERTGHYEWVLPWAYDTASHGDYNELFRGHFQGCDYMDLSPEKHYHYRVARPHEEGTEDHPRKESP